MANEISSITSISASSSAVKNSRQVAKTDVAKLPAKGGKTLPSTGKELPAQAVDSAHISEAVSQINVIVQYSARFVIQPG